MVSLGKTIRNIAREKGMKASRFIWTMVLLWIGLEIVGMYIGLSLFGSPFAAYFCAIIGAAFGGYLAYRNVVNAQPETLD